MSSQQSGYGLVSQGLGSLPGSDANRHDEVNVGEHKYGMQGLCDENGVVSGGKWNAYVEQEDGDNRQHDEREEETGV